jgi:hypothetical protein
MRWDGDHSGQAEDSPLLIVEPIVGLRPETPGLAPTRRLPELSSVSPMGVPGK